MSARRFPSLIVEVVCASLALYLSISQCQAQATTGAPDAKVVVGTMRVAPFASRSDDGQWSGLSIELWRRVAQELDLDFEFREFDYDVHGLLNAIEDREVGVAIANLPVTADGETRFDFSHPYFAAGLGIAIRAEARSGLMNSLAALPWRQILGTVSLLFAALLAAGSLIWFLERRRNPAHFDPDPLKGLGDGVWWAAVTMTTTGYGDKAPITWHGRLVGLVWMFTSIFCIAAFSATLASSFVVGKLRTGITGPEDLPQARVGVVAGTAGEQWARLQGLKTKSFPFVIQASKALQRGEIEALVFERAILGHMINEYAWANLQILPQTLAIRDYALAFPAGSALKEDVNRALLKVTQDASWEPLVQRYVGTGGN